MWRRWKWPLNIKINNVSPCILWLLLLEASGEINKGYLCQSGKSEVKRNLQLIMVFYSNPFGKKNPINKKKKFCLLLQLTNSGKFLRRHHGWEIYNELFLVNFSKIISATESSLFWGKKPSGLHWMSLSFWASTGGASDYCTGPL